MSQVQNYGQSVKVMALCRYAAVGPRLFELLMTRFGSLDEILGASPLSLHDIGGMSESAVDRIAKAEDFLPKAKEVIDTLAEREIRVITRVDDDYPNLLNELNDPPPLLYVRGRVPVSGEKSVAVVGTSEATNEGIELTVQIARRFAEAGVQVVSSLRMGIDAAAHLGARAADRHTFAVIDTGFDHLLATDQVRVAIDALHAGGIISEHPPERAGQPTDYVQANRLLVGLSNAVIITEVYKASREQLDLVEFCGQIGKLVFFLTHPSVGPLSDEATLEKIAEHGVIPMNWPDDFEKIVKALV